MATNRHRWKLSVGDGALRVLEASKKRLQWAWAIDKKDPRSFPLNTDYVFAEIDDQLSEVLRHGSLTKPQTLNLPLLLRPPKRLSDLVDEKTIKAVYEQQNEGSYEVALTLAASGKRKGTSAWRKIWLAANDAYLIRYYGVEFIPRPRVQYLHRKLLEIRESRICASQCRPNLRDYAGHVGNRLHTGMSGVDRARLLCAPRNSSMQRQRVVLRPTPRKQKPSVEKADGDTRPLFELGNHQICQTGLRRRPTGGTFSLSSYR